MQPMPLAMLVEEFLECYVHPIRAKTTCRLMHQSIRELRSDMTLKSSTDLAPSALWRWAKRFPDRTPITRSVHLRNLRVFCNYAVGRGCLTASPFSFDSKLRKACHVKSDARRRHHSLDEIGCVLWELKRLSRESWEGGRMHALASLVAFTGVRAREAQYAEVEDFDLEAGFFRVEPKPGHPLKTESSERDVPLPPPLVEVLRSWLPRSRSTWAFPGTKKQGPWVHGSDGYRPLDQLKAAGQSVGVRGFTFLSLRHSFITHGAGRWGLADLMIQQIAGHSLAETKKHYLGRDMSNLRLAVETVAFPSPTSTFARI